MDERMEPPTSTEGKAFGEQKCYSKGQSSM